jgi:hypothetical protein
VELAIGGAGRWQPVRYATLSAPLLLLTFAHALCGDFDDDVGLLVTVAGGCVQGGVEKIPRTRRSEGGGRVLGVGGGGGGGCKNGGGERIAHH